MKAHMGLRERKKRMQRQELLDIAARLFRQDGFEGTRMDDMAAEANVSTKTVYNYFPNKQSILAALLEEDRTRLISAYEGVLKNPPPSLPEAIAALMLADVGEVLTAEDKKLWRELIAAELKTNKKDDAELSKNNLRFLGYIENLLSYFKRKGDLSSNISINQSAEIIYAIYYHNFINYCRTDEMCIDTFCNNIVTQANLIVRSWRL